jgi:hypothetical protein
MSTASQTLMDAAFEGAVKVAACPHIGTCRQESGIMPRELPSPDFIGSRYRGLVIIGGNPGVAHKPAHFVNDDLMFDYQRRIAQGERVAFEKLMAFLPESMRRWPQMVNDTGRRLMDYDIEEVAYVDIVKCATKPGSSDLRRLFRHAPDVIGRCWTHHTKPLLELLKPTHIVALWKPIVPTLQSLGYIFPKGVPIGHYNGCHSWSLDRRYAGAKAVFDAFR